MKFTSETKRFRIMKKGRVEFCISMMLPSSRSYGLLRTDGHGCFPTDGFFAIRMNIRLQLRCIVTRKTKFQFLEIKSQQSTSASERFAYREKYNIALG